MNRTVTTGTVERSAAQERARTPCNCFLLLS